MLQYLKWRIVIKQRLISLIKRTHLKRFDRGGASFLQRVDDAAINIALLLSRVIKPSEMPILIGVALSVLTAYVAGTGTLRGGIDYMQEVLGWNWKVIILCLLGGGFISLKNWHPVLNTIGVIPVVLFSFGFGLGFLAGHYGIGAGFAFVGFLGLGVAMVNNILIDFRLKAEEKARKQAEAVTAHTEKEITQVQQEIDFLKARIEKEKEFKEAA